MNIAPINQNNNSQSFGMALKLRGNAARNLAEDFASCTNPKQAEEYFINHIAKPIEDLKSKVLYDGKRVIVEDETGLKAYEVLDNNVSPMMPFQPKESHFRQIGFHVKEIGADNVSVYTVNYRAPQNRGGISSTLALSRGDELKLLCAKEIGKDLDRIAAENAQKAYSDTAKQKAIEETTDKLNKMFGA